MDTEDKEILKLYLNKHNFIILPTNNRLYYEPTYERVERALKNFEGSYALALEIQKLYDLYEKKIAFEKCIQLANRMWSYAHPYFPNKVAWHEGCQGWFEIWKEVKTNIFFIECSECSLQFNHPEDIGGSETSEIDRDLSVFPTVNEIKDHGWYKYITYT